MNTEEKEALAHTGDMGLKACSLRLQAARRVASISQRDVAAAVNIRASAYSNMENCRSFPSREVMKFFYRNHRIDFNFLLHGDYPQLPGDVQTPLFSALAAVASESGQKADSDRRRAAGTSLPIESS